MGHSTPPRIKFAAAMVSWGREWGGGGAEDVVFAFRVMRGQYPSFPDRDHEFVAEAVEVPSAIVGKGP